MSWDNLIENTGYWLEVASNRMARRALHVEAKSLSKFAEDESISEWIQFLPEKGLTKSLKRDISVVLTKMAYDKAKSATASNQDKSEKIRPEDAN